MLCDTCRTLVLDILTSNLDPLRWTVSTASSSNLFSAVHGDFGRSVSCRLCHFICERISKSDAHSTNLLVHPFWNTFSDGNYHSPVSFCVVRTSDFQPDSQLERMEFFVAEGGPTEWLCEDSTEQRIIDDLDVLLQPKIVAGLSRATSRYSGSDAGLNLASYWSSRCAQDHRRCERRRYEQPLPNRVIDVGNALDECPRLIESHGQRGFYATLSHRWGDAESQYCTTKYNISQHLYHLDFNALPSSFRDAISVCRRLDIQFLWIDCLCIVQGDDGDWHKECKNMSKIFENSYLTISALRAENSRDGIFHERQRSPVGNSSQMPVFRLQDGTFLGLCWYQNGGHITEDLGASTMTFRGWILQERLLSPAILHFGRTQLHWECRGLTASENRPNVLTGGVGLLKNFLLENHRFGFNSRPGGQFIAWYTIVSSYSRTSLTLESDRLPAVAGLAQRLKQSFGNTYYAGIWLEDIHRGLLWRTDSNQSRENGKDVAIAPSWSWVSYPSGVSFELPRTDFSKPPIHPLNRILSHTASTDMDLVDVKVTRCPDLQRSAIKGRIRLWGIVVRVSCVGHANATFSTIRRYKKGELLCYLDYPSSALFHCYCLVIGTWQFAEAWISSPTASWAQTEVRQCFLVLRRAQPRRKHSHPYDLGVFERIGMGGNSPEKIAVFISGSEEKRFLTIV
jgi:hypothetical protein